MSMTIDTIGHDLHYNVWLVAKLFFDEKDAVHITSTAIYENDTVTAQTWLKFEAASISDTYSFPCPGNADAHTKKRLTSAV